MGAKSPGGLEKYSDRIAQEFERRGFVVVYPQIGTICKWPGFLRLEQFDRQVSSWLKKNPVDIVFGMERTRSQTHIRAGNGVHAAYLKSRRASDGLFKYLSCKINPLHLKILELEKEAFESKELKKIFVNSEMVKRDLLDNYSVDPSKIHVIHNGVEWKEYEKPFQAWEKKDQGRLELLFIGNGYRRKGLIPLLHALVHCKGIHLTVIGKDKKIATFKKYAEKLGLEVNFLGPQKDLTPYYLMADALTIPSFYDPFANVTLEALSFGLFVITSKSNGAHEILNKENGVVIEDLNSLEEMIAALGKAFIKTKESSKKIRASVAQFDFSNQLNKLIDAV